MSTAGVKIGLRILKGVAYVALCALAVIIVILIVMLAYNTAIQTTVVNMIAKDAFARRAQAVLIPAGDYSDREALEKLFTPKAISEDEVLNSSYYNAYNISNYYEHADVEFKIVWPWENETEIKVTEIVLDIKGTVAEANEASENAEEAAVARPISWENGVYLVKMKRDKVNDNWRIDKMELIEHVFMNEGENPVYIEDYTTEKAGQSVFDAKPEQSAGMGLELDSLTEAEDSALP